MKLTKNERLILSNQYRILEALYPKEADSLRNHREIVENGYEIFYSNVGQHVYDEVMPIEESREVLDILDMFGDMQRAYSNLKNKSKIDEHSIKFDGFDGNDPTESRYSGFVRFLASEGKWEELKLKDHSLNSHMISLDMYRRMLDEWRASKNKHDLSQEDLIRIIDARTHPSQRKN